MYVPNYIPEPLEVPSNVTEQPYLVRLRFVRRVTLLHLISLGLVGLISQVPLPQVGLMSSLVPLVVLFLALDLIRIRTRGRDSETRLSAVLLPVVVLTAAWNIREIAFMDLPVWPFIVGPAAAMIYTLLCGRDYSFVGCWLLSLISSTVIVAAIANQFDLGPRRSAFALGGNGVFLTYVLYDLASLQARRRVGEELSAVTDLYRDVFNIFGYISRVIGHWKKHKIWVAPR